MQETEEQYLNKPTTTTTSLELESQHRKTKKPLYKRSCCGVITAVILLLAIVIIILILTVFKVKDPTMKLTSTKISGVAPRVSLPSIQIELNITLDLKISVHNPNYASFKYGSGESQVYYQGEQVGEVEILPGKIGSRGTDNVDARLTLEAEKVDMSKLVSDVLGGKMGFEIRTRVPGRAKILGFIKKHVVAVSTCQVEVEIPSLDVSRQECENKTEL